VRYSVLTITLFLLVLTAGSCRDDDLPSPIVEMTTSTAAAMAGSVPVPTPTSTAGERIADPGGELTAAPNPISVCDGSGTGVTTLTWKAHKPGTYELRVVSGDAPEGKLFAMLGQEQSATTGKWVRDGMTFYIVDGSGKTVANLSMRVNADGCR
jgi:hypothetical protein